MNRYQWKIKDLNDLSLLDAGLSYHPVFLKIVAGLGLKKDEIDRFVSPNYNHDLNSPMLFSDMQKALDRLWFASVNQQKIMIFGDYDADGVCGSSIIYRALTFLNFKVEVYLPDREKEGYGLNCQAVDYAKKIDCQLIISVDCGISNRDEVEYAKKQGIDVIITDHHDVPEKVPEAVAIIHPGWDRNYPFSGLSGGGVAFKLVSAIIADKRYSLSIEDQDKYLKWQLDLVAISTVADMVPLIDENRVLVYYGLQVLRKTRNLGLQKMILTAQKSLEKMDETSIGYVIAPRINAAGRMVHANIAFKLLTTDNIVEAIELSLDLEKSNSQRQQEVEQMVDFAFKQLGDDQDSPTAIVVADNWPTGLIGLVASKLSEKYNRPSLVITRKDEKAVGSGRSPADFNLISCLHGLNKFFDRYGGHPGAAGFSMEYQKVTDFIADFNKIVGQTRSQDEQKAILNINAEINGDELESKSALNLVEDIQKLAPFGMNNPEPVLAIFGARIVSSKIVGNNAKHLSLQLSHRGFKFKAIAFGFGQYEQNLQPGELINLAFRLTINEWQGIREVQCVVVDIVKN